MKRRKSIYHVYIMMAEYDNGLVVKFIHHWHPGYSERYFYRPTKSSLARLVGIMFEREGMECGK